MAILASKRFRLGLLASIVVVCAVIAGGAAYVTLIASRFGECRNALLTSTLSPDGSKSVVTFRKECGATVADSTHASIVPTGGAPEKLSPFFSVAGVQDIIATWRGDHVLMVSVIPGGSRILRGEQSAGGIRIKYE
jgi:hypothetical protein